MPESQRQVHLALHPADLAPGGFVAQPVGATAHKKLFSSLSII